MIFTRAFHQPIAVVSCFLVTPPIPFQLPCFPGCITEPSLKMENSSWNK